MSDNGVVWEDPPRRTFAAKGIWRERLAPLVEHPGRWARVMVAATPNAAAQAVANLRRDHYRLPEGGWEFRSARIGDGTGAIYARYLGAEDGKP